MQWKSKHLNWISSGNTYLTKFIATKEELISLFCASVLLVTIGRLLDLKLPKFSMFLIFFNETLAHDYLEL